jgi:hypothetical protein
VWLVSCWGEPGSYQGSLALDGLAKHMHATLFSCLLVVSLALWSCWLVSCTQSKSLRTQVIFPHPCTCVAPLQPGPVETAISLVPVEPGRGSLFPCVQPGSEVGSGNRTNATCMRWARLRLLQEINHPLYTSSLWSMINGQVGGTVEVTDKIWKQK